MIGLEITFSPQLRDVQGRFARMEGETLDMRRGQLEDGLRSFVAIAREEAPKRTGSFASDINSKAFVSGKNLVGEVYLPSPLGAFIQRGTRPHVIRSRRPGGALRFDWPAKGGMHFFRSVRHPGTRANPFMDRAVQIWLPPAAETLYKMALSFVAYVTR